MTYRRRSFFRTLCKYLISTLLICTGVYALSGFLIIPWLATPRLAGSISLHTGRECQIESLRLNPFTLSATVNGFKLSDSGGNTLLSFAKFHTNIQILPFLFSDEVHLKELSLEDPFLMMEIDEDGEVNFADILEKILAEKESPEQKNPKPNGLHIKIDNLAVANGSFSFSDLSQSTPFKSLISPINLEINEFHTSGESDAPYGFTATTEAGESIKCEGYVSFKPAGFEGTFEVTNFSLPKYDTFSDIFLHTDILDGTVNLSGSYRYFSGNNPEAELQVSRIEIRGMNALRESGKRPFLSMGSGIATGIVLDFINKNLKVQSVATESFRLNMVRTGNSKLDLLNLIKSDESATRDPVGNDPVTTDKPSGFSFSFDRILMEDAAIEITDNFISTPAVLSLNELNLELENLSSEEASPSTISISTNIGTGGSISAVGEFHLRPIRAEMKIEIADFALIAGNPYVKQFADIQFQEGEFNLAGELSIDFSADVPDGNFSGSGGIIGLDVDELTDGGNLISLSLFNLNGIEARLNPLAINIEEISIMDPQAEIAINNEGMTNLAQAFRVSSRNPGESGIGEGESDRLSAPEQTDTSSSAPPYSVTIGLITLENMGADFTDASVNPPVKLELQALSGSIEKLSTDSLARADLYLSGELTGKASLTVKGEINPLISDKYSDMEISFEEFDLASVSPYSGKYVGYELTEGKLSFNLDYTISHSQLSGENIIHIDQLVLGNKVQSESAPNFSLPLAVALLKDPGGMIEIDVPVSGNLNDPEFSFGRVIGRALFSVISKVVTSPFSILGNLAGGGDDLDLSRVEFSPGSMELDEQASRKLDLLATALTKRPNIQLRISGSAGGPREIESLKRRYLDSVLKEMKVRETKTPAGMDTPVSNLQLTGDERQRLIQERFFEEFPEEAVGELPKTVTKDKPALDKPARDIPETDEREIERKGLLEVILATFTGSSVSETGKESTKGEPVAAEQEIRKEPMALPQAREPMVKLSNDEMEQRILATIQISQDKLAELANERAETVHNYLTESDSVDPDRLRISPPRDPASIGPAQGDSQVTFDLD